MLTKKINVNRKIIINRDEGKGSRKILWCCNELKVKKKNSNGLKKEKKYIR